VAYITVASFRKMECRFLVRERPFRNADRHIDYLREGVPQRLIGWGGYSGGTSVGIFICRAASFEKVRSGSVPLRRAPIFASVPTR
jgi:hypothetical protein